MKIPLLLIVLLASINVFASCPVDGDLTSCSIATFQTQLPMQNTYSRKSSIKEFSNTPEARLNPIQNDIPRKQLRDFGPNPADYSYNTNCQFGICNPSGTPELFKDRGQ